MALLVPESDQRHTCLVVLLHAFRKQPHALDDVAAVVRERMPDAHVVAPRLPLRMWSFADLGQVSWDVVALIDRQVDQRASRSWAPFEEIVLVGHSTGSMISRKAYVIACGETTDAPFTHRDRSGAVPLEPRKPWAGRVTRIIQLAGMNGGWSVSHHMGLRRSVQFSMGRAIGDVALTVRRKRLAIDHIRRGSPFLTGLRLEWLAMLRHAARDGRTPAMVVQLLGTIDDLVSPEDNLDIVTGNDFLYLDVARTGHVDVVRFDRSEAGRIRRDRFVLALTGSREQIAQEAVVPVDAPHPGAAAGVTDVVFVIHGIRDTGFWTHKIARRVQAAGRAATPPRVFATETSTYGYFPMLSFLLPSRRRDKVAWLTDRYVRAKAAYPTARFAFVGHSNGTYLLAKALADNPAVRFTNVVFAGSVVRRHYDWATAVARGQVAAVLNYVATNDKVVACFPGALEWVLWQDLGGAGHKGFAQATRENRPFLVEKRFVEGAHGAALEEHHWDDIARFVCWGTPPHPLTGSGQGWFIRVLGTVPWIAWLLILTALAAAAWGIWQIPSEGLRVFAYVVFAWVVTRILTRF